eukprot:TRINITY_DN8154_c0_g1_i3.p1 TRINITY_DN8154_c0_g1~~TRINITY_DN8154_c0_g1_i3.p1  ORF type:complete len:298 (-),score=64.21 TRINITY_DN8154_c0_g1_i3:72-965(-)
MVHLIKTAEHFIFIENQYFISSINKVSPKNKLLNALYQRVKTAITKKEKFRVVIILPVYPAGDLQSASTRYIIKYVYKAISRQGGSILEMLKADFPEEDLSQYIGFYALRNYSPFGRNLITEQIYVHAKLMIVDDRVTVIGSANINDRSLRGSRDSEIAIVTSGGEMIDSYMGGEPYKVSKFAHELRVRLWNDYLGLPASDLTTLADPVVDSVFRDMWHRTAEKNTQLYASVFASLPDSLTKLFEFHPEDETELSDLPLLEGVKGFLVLFPMNFLSEEQLSPTIFEKEFLVPRVVFI